MIKTVLMQMKNRGIIFHDFWAEYYHGDCIVYGWNEEKCRYYKSVSDVIAASFSHEFELTEIEMQIDLSEYTKAEFESAGFELG